MAQAFVLLSGGIDSTTCLHIAEKQFGRENVQAVSIDYGQRHRKEADFAAQSCKSLGVGHMITKLPNIIPSTMLTDEEIPIPSMSYDDIHGVSPTYVPFRNGFLLSALTSIFHGELIREFGVDNIPLDNALYFGAHSEDAQNWAYPDCTPEFIGAMANAMYVGTYGMIRLHTPLQWLRKSDIIKLGEGLSVDWSSTWSCYQGGDMHCGVCPTCRSRRKGFIDAGVNDPTTYEYNPD